MTLKDDYQKRIAKQLAKETGLNPMAVPKLVKIVVNCGMGDASQDKKALASMSEQLAVITGQRPVVTRAKKAISSFKIREGDPVGLKVTLGGEAMYGFFTRLVRIALPRVRDFRGVPRKAFDGKGNYTLGIEEQTIFPELDYSLVDKVRGFEVTFVTTAKTDKHALRLLELMGMPFEKTEGSATS